MCALPADIAHPIVKAIVTCRAFKASEASQAAQRYAAQRFLTHLPSNAAAGSRANARGKIIGAH
jgi:hypothetical protein